jgi:hypothetical protein
MERRIDRCLAMCRGWAEGRVASGNEPPWAWYQYMKLIETVAAIQTSRAAVAEGVSASVQTEVPVSPPKGEAVTDIGARRRQRRDDDDDDDDPSLPM